MRLILCTLAALTAFPLLAHAQEQEKTEKTEEKKPEVQAPHSSVTLLTGTYDPRGASLGSLRQYTVAANHLFLDYLKGDGPMEAEVIGVGVRGAQLLPRREDAALSPLIEGGWGVYHSRRGSSETKLAWRLCLGVETKLGFVAKLQILDTRLQQGDLRGSSLLFGWRF